MLKPRQRKCHDIFSDGMNYIDNSTLEEYRMDGRQLLFIGVQKCGHCPEKCEHYHKAVGRLSKPKPVGL